MNAHDETPGVPQAGAFAEEERAAVVCAVAAEQADRWRPLLDRLRDSDQGDSECADILRIAAQQARAHPDLLRRLGRHD
ncbi:hypothetical protein JJV70_14040 [Streptomyces sp. JJ66]|uniref:hypothetical protein n=1 Tax=Streptomyces sp. JJ66 TaxID=2803843 RepID=UPI001C58596F|nr:hypothetical protein [Streptomyces sp. JJ66]MBW1603201.1 hypothetical protein [Streptomyces sp. JJ66]